MKSFRSPFPPLLAPGRSPGCLSLRSIACLVIYYLIWKLSHPLLHLPPGSRTLPHSRTPTEEAVHRQGERVGLLDKHLVPRNHMGSWAGTEGEWRKAPYEVATCEWGSAKCIIYRCIEGARLFHVALCICPGNLYSFPIHWQLLPLHLLLRRPSE